MKIEDWRIEIDEIDEQIVGLLNTRAKLAVKIGESKMIEEIPICDAGREQDVIERVLRANRGPLDERAVNRIFRCIISESRRVETQRVNTNAVIKQS